MFAPLKRYRGKLLAFLALAVVFHMEAALLSGGALRSQLQLTYATRDLGVEIAGPQFVRSASVQLQLSAFSTYLDPITDAEITLEYDPETMSYQRGPSDPGCKASGKKMVVCKAGELRGYRSKQITTAFKLLDTSFICSEKVLVVQASIHSPTFEGLDENVRNDKIAWQSKVDSKCLEKKKGTPAPTQIHRTSRARPRQTQ